MANKRDIIACLGEGAPSLNCTGGKTENDYYVTYSIWSNGKARYCKKCLDKIYDNYYKKSGDSDKIALYYTLLQINTPLISEIYTKLKEKNDKVTINKYMTEFVKYSHRKNVWGDFSSTDIKLVDTESGNLNADEELEKLEKIWGVQEDIKDYEFLEDTYKRYTNEIEEMTVQQQDLYRDLCRDRLLLRKLSENGYQDNDMITKIQTRLNTLMKTLKIDNFESNQKRTLSEQSFIEKGRLIEEHDPLEVYGQIKKEDYADITHRKKYYSDLVLRPLCNTLAGHKDFNIDISDLEVYNIKGDK